MKKKWIWLLLPAALLLLILLHVHSLARLAPSEIGRQVPVLMYHAVGDDCWGEEHLFVRPAKLEQQPQLRALTQSGLVSIQSHGWSHHEMETMKRPELLKEMFRSRNAIAAASGRVPYAVSYPNGRSSERTRKIAGWFYTYGIRTFEGVYVTGSDSMLIERIAVKRDTTLEAFQAACQSAGQPTALPQQTP